MYDLLTHIYYVVTTHSVRRIFLGWHAYHLAMNSEHFIVHDDGSTSLFMVPVTIIRDHEKDHLSFDIRPF